MEARWVTQIHPGGAGEEQTGQGSEIGLGSGWGLEGAERKK